MSSERFIKIPKIWIQSKDDTDGLINIYGDLGYCFCLYCLLFQDRMESGGSITIYNFLNLFGFTKNRATKNNKQKEIIKSIIQLSDNGLIKFYSDFTYSSTISFNSDVDINEFLYIEVDTTIDSNFIILYKHEISKILSTEGNRLSLLVQFSTIVSYINNKSKLAYLPLDVMSEMSCMSIKTNIKYNTLLYDMELLYFENAGLTYYRDDDYFKSYTNTYSRYKDRQKVVNYVEYQRKANKRRITNTSKQKQDRSNLMKSLKMKLNHLNKKTKAGGLSEEDEIKLMELQKEYDEIVAIRDKEREKMSKIKENNKKC